MDTLAVVSIISVAGFHSIVFFWFINVLPGFENPKTKDNDITRVRKLIQSHINGPLNQQNFRKIYSPIERRFWGKILKEESSFWSFWRKNIEIRIFEF